MRPTFIPKDDKFALRVKESFERQKFMAHIGAVLAIIEPGFCEIQVPYHVSLTQQHGFFHAGVVGTLADNAGGYAAYSLMAEDSSILTVEYKLNLVSPAKGEVLIGRSWVEKYGKTLTICRSEVYVKTEQQETLCALSQMTLIELKNTADT